MAPLKKPKTRDARFTECNAIIAKMIEELQIPEHNESVRLLNNRMSVYIDSGRFAEDRIPLINSNRYIMYRFPKWEHEQVEVTLRVGLLTHYQLPPDLAAELDSSSRNAT